MKENDDYCGFLCSDIIERQKKIIEDIKDFAEYNPDFALVMLSRIADLCVRTLNSGLEMRNAPLTTTD